MEYEIEIHNELQGDAADILNQFEIRYEAWSKHTRRAAMLIEDEQKRGVALGKFKQQSVEKEKELDTLRKYYEVGPQLLQKILNRHETIRKSAYNAGFAKGRDSIKDSWKPRPYQREAFRAAHEVDTVGTFSHLY